MDGNIYSCYSVGQITGHLNVGGLIGYCSSYTYPNSVSIHNSYSTCNVDGLYDVGGLIGFNSWKSIITNCYSVGDVNGINNIGGLIGTHKAPSVISHSFWSTQIQTHGTTQSIGLNQGTETNVTGLPTAQMQQQATYTTAPSDWDLINTWAIGENQTYPYLRQTTAWISTRIKEQITLI